MNPYGGYRDYSGSQLWLGCPLVVHRRCLDPMFSISNEIAYNNRMFKETAEPKDNIQLSMLKSCWIDVQGTEKGGNNHFVPAQGTVTLELVRKAIENSPNGLPGLYIISPFTTVIYELKLSLFSLLKNCSPALTNQEINIWLSKSCGTVHTFQGKEANEVLFVLGCDKKSGVGAAAWAGSKPNILNVAASRAKYRLTIIGDKTLWRNIPYFNTALDFLT